MTRDDIMRPNPPINAEDFGVPSPFAERAENYARWRVAAEREAIIDIVAMHGGSVEIEAAIRARGE